MHLRAVAASGLALATVRAGGLSRDLLLSRWIGFGPDLDPYFFAFSILVIALGVIMSIAQIALLPAYSRETAVLTARRSRRLVAAGLAAVATGVALANTLPGGAGAGALLFAIVPAGGSIAFSARLASSGRQLAAVLPGLALAVVPLAGALALQREVGLARLISFVLLAYATEIVVLAVLSRPLHVAAGHGLRKAFDRTAVAGLGGASMISTAWLVIDLAFVRSLGETAVSLYSLATRIPQGLSGVLIPAITNVLMPTASRSLAGADDLGAHWPTIRRTAALAALVGVGMAIVNVVLAVGLRRFVFAGSAVATDEANEIVVTQAIHGMMLPMLIAGVVIVRYFQAANHHRPILLSGLATLAVNTTGDAVLAPWLGVRGIALATVAAYTLSCAVLWTWARRLGTR